LKWLKAKERPSTVGTLKNTIYRYPLSGDFFQNDPDVFILRDKKNKLSENEKYTMLLVNNLFGKVIFTSDNIAEYTDEQYQQFASIFPYRTPFITNTIFGDELYSIEFKIDDREYLAKINLSNKSTNIELEADYYDAKNNIVLEKGTTIQLKKRQSVCYYKVDEEYQTIELLGGEGHLFSGAECNWELRDQGQKYTLTYLPKTLEKHPVYIRLEPSISSCIIHGQEYEAQEINNYWGIKLNP